MFKNKITERQLSFSFDAGTFARGKVYFKADHVDQCKIENETETSVRIRGRVANGRGRHYKTHATLHLNPDLVASGWCNCPVGVDCKHSVALLLSWFYTPQTHISSEDAPEKWLQRLQGLTQSLALSESSGSSGSLSAHVPQIFFELHINAENRLTLSVLQYRVLKNGRYGKPYYFKHYEIQYTQRMIAPQDETAFSRIKEMVPLLQPSWESEHAFVLEEEAAWFMLQSLLTTQRCFYQDLSQILSLGKALSLQALWEQVPQQSVTQEPQQKYRLILRVSEPVRAVALNRAVNVYLDTENNLLGLIENPFSPLQKKILAQAPPLTIEQMLKAIPALQQVLPHLSLPEGISEQVLEEIIGVVPVPELVLETQPSGKHQGKLRFNYEGVCVPADHSPQSLVAQDGFLYQVARDVFLEKQATEILQQSGFQQNAEGLWCAAGDQSHVEAEQWLDFLKHDKEWDIDDTAFDFKVFRPDAWQAEIQQTGQDVGSGWFSLELGIEVDGKHYDLQPFLLALLQRYSGKNWQAELAERSEVLLPLPGKKPRWLCLESERVASILGSLLAIYDQEHLGQERQLNLGFFDALSLDALLGLEGLSWLGADDLKALMHQLRNFETVTPVSPPQALQAQLRSYQQVGLNWLQFLRQFGFHGVLADDMGLGKTLQTLAHLLVEKEAGRLKQALIVAPTSVVSNWLRESERFCPTLRVACFTGADRDLSRLNTYDVIITSYALWRRDSEKHLCKTYTWLILDEAQNIKNPRSKGAQIAYAQPAHHRLCLTGTPMENHLGELWSLYHFLMPGFLGNAKQFKERFQVPIEKEQNPLRQAALRQRLKPFLLRRHKTQVEQDLPPKTEVIQKIPLSKKQRDFYETLRASMHKEVQAEIEARGIKKSQFFILEALLKLRQVCCAPHLLKLKAAEKVPSAKLEHLMDLLQTLSQEGRRILVFSQFVSMLDLIANELSGLGIAYEMLTGSTRQRDTVIDRFQTGSAPVFLISLKAGGVGINLTAADTVIHYDPWWNPAVERQATDRSWRMGQDKKVFVYKLIAESTIEEKILQLQTKKQRLADSIEHENAAELRISQSDLLNLLSQTVDEA